mmetsp:Transcript_20868/g.37256  ORF Transcript_20868/g.37256 Transcript_20868/m.37256 type:complete len:268 (-) Transcript_20868:90-893(-)
MAGACDADRARAEFNLKVLKRFDAAIEEILASVGHVALYDLNVNDSKWSRKDIEGSLFFVRRSAEPLFQLIVLNKKSPNNFTEGVTASFRFEIHLPYLMYRNTNSEVIGIWFYHTSDCEIIESCLNTARQQLEEGTLQHEQPQASYHSTVSTSTAAPSAASQLLPPSFFTGNSSRVEQQQPPIARAPSHQHSVAGAPQQDDSNPLERLFAGAMRLNDQPATTAPVVVTSSSREVLREQVRSVAHRLLANDQFMDIIVAELENLNSGT